MACGNFHVKGKIGAVAAGLNHSHSNTRSEPHLQLHHSSQQCWILSLLSEARDQTCILMDTSQACNLLSHSGNSPFKLTLEIKDRLLFSNLYKILMKVC